jgi:Zn-dependent membrane protease YugP
LLDALGLRNVTTEVTDRGDHYDPLAKAVRLTTDNFNGRSLTAVTIAAHEVGHALQDARGFAPLRLRTHLVHWVAPIEKLGAGMLMMAPLMAAVMRSPRLGLVGLAGGMLTLGAAVVVHFLTLPTELDASFTRALPLLKQHHVIRPEDLPRARRLLTAAAFTYVAVALQSLLNIARWWAILRR